MGLICWMMLLKVMPREDATVTHLIPTMDGVEDMSIINISVSMEELTDPTPTGQASMNGPSIAANLYIFYLRLAYNLCGH